MLETQVQTKLLNILIKHKFDASRTQNWSIVALGSDAKVTWLQGLRFGYDEPLVFLAYVSSGYRAYGVIRSTVDLYGNIMLRRVFSPNQ